jgi:predicted RNA binding protein YcfA (HicA-like mRNA interferase family)
MSEKLPRVTAKEIAAVVEKLGFIAVMQSGSHRIYRNQAGRRVTIPMHGSKVLHPKILKSILFDAEISRDQLRDLL